LLGGDEVRVYRESPWEQARVMDTAEE
jgi:hypothetical protein